MSRSSEYNARHRPAWKASRRCASDPMYSDPQNRADMHCLW